MCDTRVNKRQYYSQIFILFLLTTGNLLGLSHAADPDNAKEVPSPGKIEPDTRIVGGTDAKLGDVPYQVSLRMVKDKGGYHFCGGTLIFSDWILTAAHCTIGKKPGDFQIWVGTLKRSGDGKVYDVDKIFNHEDYDNVTLANDIAVIRVTTFIRYDQRTIDKITLATEELPTGAKCKISGWGYTDTFGRTQPDNLQILTVTTISNEKCKKYFAHIKPTNVCTYVNHRQGICQGDSGGPLTYQDEVVAIASFNYPCARGLPDGFTRVLPYRKWIKNIVLSNLDD